MRILNNLTARCHDDDCIEREQCLRWLQRRDGDASTEHAPTFTSALTFGKCPAKITEDNDIHNQQTQTP